MLVILPWICPSTTRRNNDFTTLVDNLLSKGIGVVSFVAQNSRCFQPLYQFRSTANIAFLAGAEKEADGTAQTLTRRMDFRRQTTT